MTGNLFSHSKQVAQSFERAISFPQNVFPELVIREGEAVGQILGLIREDESIGVLVLGASEDGGPGPLVTQMSRNAGGLPVPLTIVPGGLSKDQLEAIT